jgi:hypothetical protein
MAIRSATKTTPVRERSARFNTGTLNPSVVESMAGGKGSMQSSRWSGEGHPARRSGVIVRRGRRAFPVETANAAP